MELIEVTFVVVARADWRAEADYLSKHLKRPLEVQMISARELFAPWKHLEIHSIKHVRVKSRPYKPEPSRKASNRTRGRKSA